MARAYTIWIVQLPGCITPDAAFTVKHELVSYLARKTHQPTLRELVIWRMSDGNGSAVPLQLSPSDLLDI